MIILNRFLCGIIFISLIGCAQPQSSNEVPVEVYFIGEFDGQIVSCYLNGTQVIYKQKMVTGVNNIAHVQRATISYERCSMEIVVDGYHREFEFDIKNGTYILFNLIGSMTAFSQAIEPFPFE